MTHSIEDWKLTAYALGELDAEDTSHVESVLASNATLREELATIQETLQTVRATLEQHAAVPLSDQQRNQLRSSLNDPVQVASREPVASGNIWRNIWFGAAALAATLLGVFAFNSDALLRHDGLTMSGPEVVTPDSESAASSVLSDAKSVAENEYSLSKLNREQLKQEVAGSAELQEESAKRFSHTAEPELQQLDAGAQQSQFGTEPLTPEAKDSSTTSAGKEVLGVPLAPQAAAPASSIDNGLSFRAETVESDFVESESLSKTVSDSPASLGSAYGGMAGADAMGRNGQASSYGAGYGDTAYGGAMGGGGYGGASGYGGEGNSGGASRNYFQERGLRDDLSSLVPRDGEERRFALPENGPAGDRFETIMEKPFVLTAEQQRTTFSIDVDTAAYSKVRQAVMEARRLPNRDAVRIEEMINYFTYNYAGPTDETPFSAQMAAADCPWNSDHKLIRIALQAKKMENKERPVSNIVFLLDVSGSMNEPNKLPLVKKSIAMLARQLGENDRIAIVVYAGAAGLVLPSTTGNNQGVIFEALDKLQAGGSTNGGQGIELAYEVARQNFIQSGVNRVILCTDGDFNVGTTGDEELVGLVERNAKSSHIFLSCFGFGMGNYNDSMMEKITNKGNGFYAMIDSELEAKKHMVEQINSTLVTVAKDVKIQVDFNPSNIVAYRQIGYENRQLANRDFNDDTKDAGEVSAGHQVTVLYEVVPFGKSIPGQSPDEEPLRYAAPAESTPAESTLASEPKVTDEEAPTEFASELLLMRVRYKKPDEETSTKLEFPLQTSAYEQPADQDFRWASAVAQFGLLLRRSSYATNITYASVVAQASAAAGEDSYRLEAVDVMRRAQSIAGQ